MPISATFDTDIGPRELSEIISIIFVIIQKVEMEINPGCLALSSP